ncbi:hypothetical protein [Curtobacterium luteum]|uniref:Uncharacterized protein n=1 Tax=Curtobacterium luteum TaxID=33881 RepID=A0A175S275_9MICO|nr:hypothetical protein [Curtobacterium luteum]KTR09201.1 hypothetical protein NS184_03455 [Curtobacterium luteum]
MTAVQPTDAARPGLPSAVPPVSVPDALTGALTVIDREARPGLLTLVTPGGAPVCEGDTCFVPGAEGVWAEVPD